MGGNQFTLVSRAQQKVFYIASSNGERLVSEKVALLKVEA
jgi:hypothetical protein